ncbi:uncharacterized protein LOC126844795 [Adelges cooleyi]|uniref:uncharacterized protein LOC126844795 n=1 Tax=Adelges cooleyi TaxID=133065 RepID=UPI0021805ED0|nr:uncharacterized protein LOC126844795 [Adelges cooleyi]
MATATGVTSNQTCSLNNESAKIDNDTDNFKLDLGDLKSGPKRPILKTFPLTKFGTQNQGFNSSYYENHTWLEYSISQDAVFCYECRIFGSYQIEPTFTSIGLKNWKKLCGSKGLKNGKQSKLDAHASTKTHLTCMAKWSGHNDVKKTDTVHTQLSPIENISKAQLI